MTRRAVTFFIALFICLGGVAAPTLGGGGPDPDVTYNCDGLGTVIVRFGEEQATLRFGTRTLPLPHARSGSGARFVASDIVFWIKGRDAMLDLGDGQGNRHCHVTDRG